MRYVLRIANVTAIVVCVGASGREASADPIRMAQVQGGGIGGSLVEPEVAPARPKPRASRPAAAHVAPAPRVIVKREIIYEPRYVARPAPPTRRRGEAREGGLASYDGVWTVSSGGGCSGAGTGQVTISAGRIIGSSGTGRVSATGAVSTVSAVAGLTIVGQGQIVGRSASGVYRQSDGCTGSWSAVKL